MKAASLGRRLRVAAWLLIAALVFAGPAIAGDEFVLGPGDKLSVVVHRRPDLSGEFRVLPSGSLPLPFVRSLPVSGRPLAEVHQAIVDRFRDDAFLLDPRVTLDLVEARPIYVAGDVRRPGAYPFQLGMTVQHAISSAGGQRTLDIEMFGARLETGRLREKLRQSLQSVGLAMIRRERLRAERADAEDLAMPAGISGFLTENQVREAHDNERTLMQQRTTALRSEIAVLGRQVAVYQQEVQALTEQGEAKLHEGELVAQESRFVENLMKQGLTPRTSRVIELQRIAIQIEGERRQIAVQITKAKQEIARVEQAVGTLTQQRQIEITTGVKDAADLVANLTIGIDEARASLIEAREVLPGPGAPPPGQPLTGVTILRTRTDGVITIAAGVTTPMLPGDLIDVPRR